MAASEYVKAISVADTTVNEVAGRSINITRSTMSHVHGDDIELHHTIANKVISENDVLTYQSIIGTIQGRIMKISNSFALFTKADVIESKKSFALITHAETVQGTMYTLFTVTTAAVFAGILLIGAHFLKKRSR